MKNRDQWMILSKIFRQTFMLGLAVSCLLIQHTFAETLVLEKEKNYYSLENKVEYLIDRTHSLTINDLISDQKELTFQTIQNTILNFDVANTPIWLKITIENPLVISKELVIQIEYAWISHLELYKKVNGAIQLTTTGVDYPNATKPIESRSYTFPIDLQAKSEQTFYIKVTNRYLTRMPISVSTKKTFIHNERIINIISGVYYGLMIAMFIYNLFLFITTKDIAYFFYIGSIFFSVSYQAAHGAIYSIVFPAAIWWNQNAILISAPMILVFMIQFGRSFLHTKSRLPKFDRFMVVTLIISAIFMAFSLTPYGALAQKAIALFALATILSQLTAGILVYRQGYKPAIYYILAYSAFVSFSTIVPASVLGIIPYSPFVAWTYQIGSGLETMLLSLALADRINTLKREKFESLKKVTEATAKSEAKSDFLAKMSHEIRTPMNGVLGMTMLLNATKLNSTQKYYTKTIQNSGKALLNVINDILDLSKIEAKKIALEKITFKLSDIIDECASIFTSTAFEKNILFFCNTKPNTPNSLIGDPARLRQIILNLLSNAFKFTDKGVITLTIDIKSNHTDKTVLLFTVQDSGIGIDPIVKKQLFQSFTQADSSITRRYGGTGLGLTIAKQLTELMQGEIGIESIPNHGSKFWFTAHFLKDKAPKKSLKNTLEHTHLTLMTHSLPLKNFISEHARYWGMEMMQTLDFSKSTPLLFPADTKEKTLILIDMDSTPIENELLEDLIEKNSHVKLLLLTKQHDIQHLGLSKKMQSYLTQTPTTSHQLYQIVQSLIAKSKLTKSFNQLSDHYPAYFKQLSILIAEDNPVNQIVIQGMLRKLHVNSTVVENGQQALEIFQQQKNYDLVFMDCEMPIMDGYTATKKIREFEKNHSKHATPIIALSAHAMQEHREKSMTSGMDDHLSKPIDIEELIETIKKWISNRSNQA